MRYRVEVLKLTGRISEHRKGLRSCLYIGIVPALYLAGKQRAEFGLHCCASSGSLARSKRVLTAKKVSFNGYYTIVATLLYYTHVATGLSRHPQRYKDWKAGHVRVCRACAHWQVAAIVAKPLPSGTSLHHPLIHCEHPAGPADQGNYLSPPPNRTSLTGHLAHACV